MNLAFLEQAGHTPQESSSPLFSQCRYVAYASARGRLSAPAAPTKSCACAVWLLLTASVRSCLTSARPGMSENFMLHLFPRAALRGGLKDMSENGFIHVPQRNISSTQH